VRYDANSFPEDIALLETRDRDNFQGRYVLHHPFAGTASCDAADAYRKGLSARFAKEAENLEGLTGWTHQDVAARMAASGQPIEAK
jgi:hypothetical protein